MLCLKARAKINWTLDILGRWADGYHQMDMLMQSVRLADTLWLEESDRLTLEDAGQGFHTEAGDGEACAAPVPFDENNLVIKAARALQKAAGIENGTRMRLRKAIPSGAGMGGGSADADCGADRPEPPVELAFFDSGAGAHRPDRGGGRALSGAGRSLPRRGRGRTADLPDPCAKVLAGALAALRRPEHRRNLHGL